MDVTRIISLINGTVVCAKYSTEDGFIKLEIGDDLIFLDAKELPDLITLLQKVGEDCAV